MSEEKASRAREQGPGSRGLPFPPAVGCLGSIVLGLIAVALFFAALTLATQGEIRLPKGQLGETRLWLVREAGVQGLGRSSTQIVSGSERSGQACVRTNVGFLLLGSNQSQESLSYCECFLKEGDLWQSTGDCPNETD